MIHLTVERTADLLRLAVAEKGANYHYPVTAKNEECTYYQNGKPDCLVGHVLHYLGLDSTRLTETVYNPGVQLQGEICLNEVGISVVLQVLKNTQVLTVDQPSWFLLVCAQERQDRNNAWGQSVTRAIERVNIRFDLSLSTELSPTLSMDEVRQLVATPAVTR